MCGACFQTIRVSYDVSYAWCVNNCWSPPIEAKACPVRTPSLMTVGANLQTPRPPHCYLLLGPSSSGFFSNATDTFVPFDAIAMAVEATPPV